MTAAAHVEVLEGVSPETFRRDVVPRNLPVLLKGAIADWPLVRAAAASPEAAVAYLRRFDRGKEVETLRGDAAIRGRFFYNDRLDGLNFTRKPRAVTACLEEILALRGMDEPPAIYIQSAPVPGLLPGFAEENALDLVAPGTIPRIWIGNRITVQTHFDLSNNLACVAAGRRRFTLFPPEQTPNLYPGPFEFTLAGPPVSMVQLDDPDFARYPNFRAALAQALVAELEPGDALFVPYFWWHHVQALDDLNVLVNHWWNDADRDLGSPFDALLHAILAIRDLPERQRAAWHTMFEHYAFGMNGDPVAHLPPPARGALGRHDAEMRRRIRMVLLNALARQAGIALPGRGQG